MAGKLQNRLAGMVDDVLGGTKLALGKRTNHDGLKTAGRRDRASGAVKQSVADAKDKMDVVTDETMFLWRSQRSDKQTDALIQGMVQDWKVSPADAREYVEGRVVYLRMKDLKQPDELRQLQRSKRWAATDGSIEYA